MSVIGRFIVDAMDFFRWCTKVLLNPQRYADEQRALVENFIFDSKYSETDKLYLTIGTGLSVWAKLEEYLVLIVALLLDVKMEQAGLIMYSILNFNVWLTLVHDLIALDDPKLTSMQTRWNKISEKIRKIKDVRDRLAHHSVNREPLHLKPSKYDIRQKTKLQRPLDLMEVLQFAQTTVMICVELEKFISDFWPLLSLEGKSAEPAPDHSPESDSQ